jgi:hypothetical protein
VRGFRLSGSGRTFNLIGFSSFSILQLLAASPLTGIFGSACRILNFKIEPWMDVIRESCDETGQRIRVNFDAPIDTD